MLAGGPIGQAQAAFSALLSSNFIDEAVGAAHAGWYRGERNETLLLSDTGPPVVDPASGQMTSDRSAETGVLAPNLKRRSPADERIDPQTQRHFMNMPRAQEWDSLWEALVLQSEERRTGKDVVLRGRFRWAPYQSTK